jgi:hypothetical protein
MQIEQIIKQIVRDELASSVGAFPPEPELIELQEAADICNCGPDTIRDLFKESHLNGFPAVVLGKKTHRVDKRRLALWLASGGLTQNFTNESADDNVVQMRKAG